MSGLRKPVAKKGIDVWHSTSVGKGSIDHVDKIGV